MHEHPLNYCKKDLDSKAPFHGSIEMQLQPAILNLVSWRHCHSDAVTFVSLLTNFYKLDKEAAVSNYKETLINVALH